MIALLGVTQIFRRNDDLELVTAADRRTWATRYFALCFFLGAAILFSHQLLTRQGW